MPAVVAKHLAAVQAMTLPGHKVGRLLCDHTTLQAGKDRFGLPKIEAEVRTAELFTLYAGHFLDDLSRAIFWYDRDLNLDDHLCAPLLPKPLFVACGILLQSPIYFPPVKSFWTKTEVFLNIP